MRMVNLTKKDESQIIALGKAAYVNYDLPLITPGKIDQLVKNGFMLGIKENGRLVSDILVFYKKPGEWFLWGIATVPEMQGRGLATTLLQDVMKRAKEKKVKIGVSIRPGNEKSLGLFRKRGFLEKGLEKDFCGPGKDRLIFEFSPKIRIGFPTRPLDRVKETKIGPARDRTANLHCVRVAS